MPNSSEHSGVKKLLRFVGLLTILLALGSVNTLLYAVQQADRWTPQQQIPFYHNETDPPVLVVDQNRTVHAFSSQWTGDERSSKKVIMYNQWTLNGGWTEPNDIFLPPIKEEARMLDAFLDHSGTMHVLFFAGDEIEANVYYSSAPAINAGEAGAWSAPLEVGRGALVPENGAMAGDNNGNLLIVYSGGLLGHGLYAVYSSDRGSTWSNPTPIFLTYDDFLWPFYLKFHLDQSGLLNVIWSLHDENNHGQAIYFARFNYDAGQWSKPVQIAKYGGFLGTKAPTLIKHQDSLFVMYYDSSILGGKQIFIRSSDGGQTWTNPVAPFPHIGFNGPGSFVVDGNGDLHVFWGQRITGSPDIHGMWHSVWQDIGWSQHDAIVSGTNVVDTTGYDAFSPVFPEAVSIQGNTLLVTWRSDPGSKGNGVFYSYKSLDAPETPVSPLPIPQVTADVTAAPTMDRTFLEAPSPSPTYADTNFNNGGQVSPDTNNPIGPLLAGLVPVILLFGLIVVYQLIRHGSS